MRKTALFAAAGLAALGSMNVARVNLTNRPVDAAETVQSQTAMPPKVATVIDRACRNCHTEQTHWPWYSHIAPFQWLVTADVYSGRDHLNLSTWSRYKTDERTDRLVAICEMVAGDKMPPLHYRAAHYPSAWLSDGDKKAVCDWVK